jgi:taurine dioxygenase
MNTWKHISVNRSTGALGAEVGGVYLGGLGDDAFSEIHAEFIEHQVLFFRNQEITREQHAFARRFGTLQIHPYLQPLKEEGHPEFVLLHSNENFPYVPDFWHSDVTFVSEPPLGSVLRWRHLTNGRRTSESNSRGCCHNAYDPSEV